MALDHLESVSAEVTKLSCRAITVIILMPLEKCEPDLRRNHWTFLGFVHLDVTETAIAGVRLDVRKVSLLLCDHAYLINVLLFFFRHLKTLPPFFLLNSDDDDELCFSSPISISAVIIVWLPAVLDDYCRLIASSQISDIELYERNCSLARDYA